MEIRGTSSLLRLIFGVNFSLRSSEYLRVYFLWFSLIAVLFRPVLLQLPMLRLKRQIQSPLNEFWLEVLYSQLSALWGSEYCNIKGMEQRGLTAQLYKKWPESLLRDIGGSFQLTFGETLEDTENPTVLVPCDIFLKWNTLLNHLREELPILKWISAEQ